jgi:hypothetical protein
MYCEMRLPRQSAVDEEHCTPGRLAKKGSSLVSTVRKPAQPSRLLELMLRLVVA